MSDQQPSDYCEVDDRTTPVVDYYESDEQQRARRIRDQTYKRLIVFCDGTGLDSDAPVNPPTRNGVPKTDVDWDEWTTPSNIALLSRFTRSYEILENGKEIEQLRLYQNGVATGPRDWFGATIGTEVNRLFGFGLNENVCEAYVWLCMNWIPGDEIFLFGFSRGAFTARALAGVIGLMGLLPRESLGGFQTIYHLYTKRGSSDIDRGDWEEWGEPGQLGQGARAPGQVKIKAIGVWGTVKSLGIPAMGYFKKWTWEHNEKYLFHNADLLDNVENAYQVLALDEFRLSFSPTIWFLPDGKQTDSRLKQVWFPGAHSDVGGSYPGARPMDSGDLSLLWMIDQVKSLLAIDTERLYTKVQPTNEKAYDDLTWTAAQPNHNSNTGVFAFGLLGARKTRTPGRHIKENDGKPTHAVGPQMEKVHWSVRLRAIKAKHQGIRTVQKVVRSGIFYSARPQFNEYGCPIWELENEYKCPALDEFEWKPASNGGGAWVKHEAGKTITLEEEPMSATDLVFFKDSEEFRQLEDPALSKGLKLHKA